MSEPQQEPAAEGERDSITKQLQRRGITLSTWRSLKNMHPGAVEDSVLLFYDYCHARKLDALKKPASIVPMHVEVPVRQPDGSVRKVRQWKDVVLPGIGELRITAHRTGEYVGLSAPEWGPQEDFMGITAPAWCRMTAQRVIGGRVCSFSAEVYFAEACGVKKAGTNNQTGETWPARVNEMWTKRPRGQLSKCGEAAVLRMTFPEELGNESTADELAGQDDAVIDGVATDVTSRAHSAEDLTERFTTQKQAAIEQQGASADTAGLKLAQAIATADPVELIVTSTEPLKTKDEPTPTTDGSAKAREAPSPLESDEEIAKAIAESDVREPGSDDDAPEGPLPDNLMASFRTRIKESKQAPQLNPIVGDINKAFQGGAITANEAQELKKEVIEQIKALQPKRK